jgi:demethylmenaquinone methyltransferase/2-methoxy-6-polyprenyl-1,4-benzoquinol methylase
MRNIPDRPGAIKEMARVVKPGGKVLILEMTFPKNLKMRQFFHWYLSNVIPILGTFIAGNRSAYRYLSDSIQNFIHPDQLTDLFRQAGLQEVREYPLTLGITYLHEGIVP